ncbi:response regulator [Bradyrhizobium sp. BR 10261]|uniref:response regulator n=1 Tax=Bradyrhizobium sp. BR 10261 TaxID=2749992 RepID=UPI00289F89BF|nr:response regulator [Bradyrhizobium sp. BR 10261]
MGVQVSRRPSSESQKHMLRWDELEHLYRVSQRSNMSEPPSILVVEDEYPLQGVLESVLADAGFASDILASGEEAMTVFLARGKRHKALVTDVYLSGKLNGWDLARRMREKDPALPVVYITGGAGAALWKSQGVPNSLLLEKPFHPEHLVAALTRP